MRKLFGWAIAFLCILAAMAAAALGEGEVTCFYRIRPIIESADYMRADGTVLIGFSRGRNLTAQIQLTTEVRSQNGEITDLRQLLRERHGTLLRASWRIETRDASRRNGNYILWPRGNKNGICHCKSSEGWNLWNVTALIQSMVKTEEPLSLRLQTRNDTDRYSAAFDISQSWIYLAISFPEALPDEYLITESDLLDAAFSALPETHWALSQYRNISGSLVHTKWPETGVPYYYGGHTESKVLHPNSPSQPSKYYKTGRTYLNGFDCAAYLHWVEEIAGYKPQDQLSEIISNYSSSFPATRGDMKNWMQVFLPGDLIVFDHGSWHIGMIIGTPRMFGLSKDIAPELEKWLDAPMMIHCGEDPFVYERFRNYITTLRYKIRITPPDGGVTVSLLINSLDEAPHLIRAPWKTIYGYINVMGQAMTVYPLSACKRLAWVQPVRLDDHTAFLVEEE